MFLGTDSPSRCSPDSASIRVTRGVVSKSACYRTCPHTQGDKAPDFTLLDQDGNAVHLADLQGRKVLVYFYPK